MRSPQLSEQPFESSFRRLHTFAIHCAIVFLAVYADMCSLVKVVVAGGAVVAGAVVAGAVVVGAVVVGVL